MKCYCPLSAGLCLELVSLRSAAAFVPTSLVDLALRGRQRCFGGGAAPSVAAAAPHVLPAGRCCFLCLTRPQDQKSPRGSPTVPQQELHTGRVSSWHLLSPFGATCGRLLAPQVPAVLRLQHGEHLKNGRAGSAPVGSECRNHVGRADLGFACAFLLIRKRIPPNQFFHTHS